MKSLYEVIDVNSTLKKENFDFTAGMNRLFSSDFQGIRDIPELPIDAEKTTWQEVTDYSKTLITKTFNFERDKHTRFFVNEILKTAEKMMHHPFLSVERTKVSVELYTHDINEVSELDLKLARFIDEIYEDIKFIQEF